MSETGETPGGGALTRAATPQYHERLRQHLESSEPELWAWFAESSQPADTEIEAAELQILKTTYRLDGDVHGVLAGVAPLIAGRLGLEQEVVLYQELGDGDRNARVTRLGDRIHVVFGGDLLDLLDIDEQEAVLAHELAHVALHDRDGRAYWVLDHLIHRADIEAVTNDAIGETARRLRLHTEVWADGVAADVVGNHRPVVSTIVKLHTGLRNVDPEAYLRQARQIVEADPSSSHGWTHPELHVRVACLAARLTPAPDEVTAQLIEGPDDLDRLDLLGQLRLEALTARVLATGAARARDANSGADDGVRSYLKNFAHLDLVGGAPITDGELAEASPSVRHLCAGLLVDLALSGGDDSRLSGIQSHSIEADRQGVAAEFDKVLSRATEQTLAEVRRLRTAS